MESEMNDLVKVIDGKVMVNSISVADHFGKSHRNVTRDIEKLISESGEFGLLNFERSSYISLQNKKLKCIDMTRDGFTLLSMGFSGQKAIEWKIKYLSAFNAMEKELVESQTKVLSVGDALNEACRLMSIDQQKASICGKALSDWSKIRKSHQEKIDKLVSESQQLLNFEKRGR